MRASQVVAPASVNTQGSVPPHAPPDQPANTELSPVEAVSVTTVPSLIVSVQSDPQEMPGGAEVTMPVHWSDSDRGGACGIAPQAPRPHHKLLSRGCLDKRKPHRRDGIHLEDMSPWRSDIEVGVGDHDRARLLVDGDLKSWHEVSATTCEGGDVHLGRESDRRPRCHLHSDFTIKNDPPPAATARGACLQVVNTLGIDITAEKQLGYPRDSGAKLIVCEARRALGGDRQRVRPLERDSLRGECRQQAWI